MYYRNHADGGCLISLHDIQYREEEERDENGLIKTEKGTARRTVSLKRHRESES